jgi:hypothetical protein
MTTYIQLNVARQRTRSEVSHDPFSDGLNVSSNNSACMNHAGGVLER